MQAKIARYLSAHGQDPGHYDNLSLLHSSLWLTYERKLNTGLRLALLSFNLLGFCGKSSDYGC